MPFVPVTKGIEYFCKVNASEPTARRKTEQAGQASVEVQTAKVEALERAGPDAQKDEPKGPELQQMSVDGAMVPLIKKQWGEAKTLAIGTVGKPVLRNGEWEAHTTELSYFSRMTDHETFARLAMVETQRRGTETAGKVLAVNDGATWEQEFVDYHRPDAVRILDFGHGAEHVAAVGQATYGVETPASKAWLKATLHELRHGESEQVLEELRGLRDELAFEGGAGLGAEALKVVVANLEYFEKRREQILYAQFEQAGYPIGSGAVESGNKLVVEARLKGAGMHWAPQHVDPMLALRNIACSDRWDEAWPEIAQRLRQQTKERSAARRARRRAAKTACVETRLETSVAVAAVPAAPVSAPELAVAAVAEAGPTAGQATEQARTEPRH